MLHQKLPLWAEGQYQGAGPIGFVPVLETYVLKGERVRSAVIICPGGGYGYVSPREAEPVALQFNAAGHHAFVLDYSVAPNRHPQPLLDVSRALCLVRENAEAWKVDPARIAVCGFSAGGHLAASLAVHWDKPYVHEAPGIRRGINRPDALILAYPVLTSGPFAHQGSVNNLLGERPDEKLLHEFSLEHHVDASTPPTFLWHTVADTAVPVENSLLFASALRKAQVPFELHIYPEGPHGLSLATAETATPNQAAHPHAATWMKLCLEWLEGVFGGTAR